MVDSWLNLVNIDLETLATVGLPLGTTLAIVVWRMAVLHTKVNHLENERDKDHEHLKEMIQAKLDNMRTEIDHHKEKVLNLSEQYQELANEFLELHKKGGV